MDKRLILLSIIFVTIIFSLIQIKAISKTDLENFLLEELYNYFEGKSTTLDTDELGELYDIYVESDEEGTDEINLEETSLTQTTQEKIPKNCANDDECPGGYCSAANRCAYGNKCYVNGDCDQQGILTNEECESKGHGAPICNLGGCVCGEIKLPDYESCDPATMNEDCGSNYCIEKYGQIQGSKLKLRCWQGICSCILNSNEVVNGKKIGNADCTKDEDCLSGACLSNNKCSMSQKVIVPHSDCETDSDCSDFDCSTKGGDPYCSASSKCACGSSCYVNGDCDYKGILTIEECESKGQGAPICNLGGCVCGSISGGENYKSCQNAEDCGSNYCIEKYGQSQGSNLELSCWQGICSCN